MVGNNRAGKLNGFIVLRRPVPFMLSVLPNVCLPMIFFSGWQSFLQRQCWASTALDNEAKSEIAVICHTAWVIKGLATVAMQFTKIPWLSLGNSLQLREILSSRRRRVCLRDLAATR